MYSALLRLLTAAGHDEQWHTPPSSSSSSSLLLLSHSFLQSVLPDIPFSVIHPSSSLSLAINFFPFSAPSPAPTLFFYLLSFHLSPSPCLSFSLVLSSLPLHPAFSLPLSPSPVAACAL